MENGGGYACAQVSVLWEIPVPSPQFSCEPKTILKDINSKKKNKNKCTHCRKTRKHKRVYTRG